MSVGAVRDLQPVVRDEAYWIGRETLAIAFHYGQGKHVAMEIAYDRKELRLRFRDDGCGIDPHVLKAGGKPGHWGMPGMRESARKIGAHLEMWSSPGAGTEVELRVPGSMAYRSSVTRLIEQVEVKR